MRYNRLRGFLILILSVFISSSLREFIDGFTGFRFHLFVDEFNILYLLANMILQLVCFIPTYLIIYKIVNLIKSE